MSGICTEVARLRTRRMKKMATFRGQRYIPAMQFRGSSIARATLLIVVSAVSFGSISVLTVLIMRAGVPLLTAMTWRYVLAGFVLLGVGGVDEFRSLSKRRLYLIFLVGGLGQALITYLSLRALEYIAVAPLAFLFYTYPAWVALIAATRRTERLTRIRILALVLALVGTVVMIGAPTSQNLRAPGVALALASAILYAIYLPSVEHLQQGVPTAACTLLIVAGAAISFVIAVIWSSEFYLPGSVAVWSNIVLLAVVSTAIAFFTLIRGLSVLGPVRTAIIATVEPFFTAILGALVLGNRLTGATLVGGASIASAVLLIHWSSVHFETTIIA
jgi:drug/metabolite transporter (DMT)-like permease